MKEMIKPLLERRSIRSYEANPVSDEQLELVLQAGSFAPSGMNEHKWKLVVFRRGGVLDQILNELGGDPFYGAPVVIAVLVDKASVTPVQDGSLAIGNMLNAAHILGLGSCWVNNMAAYFESNSGKEMKAKYHIPSDYFCVGSCAVGYRKGDMPKVPNRPQDMIIFAD